MTTFTEAQQALIDRYRDINTDYDWWEGTYERFKERMDAIGIQVDRMYFSGFWSQGDGACFEGQVSDWGLFLPSVGITNDVLVEFACNHWSFGVKHRGRYYHEECTYFHTDMPNPAAEDDEWFIERYSPYGVSDFRSVAWLAVLRGFDFSSMGKTFRDSFKDHMRQLYKDLEAEYDYRTSDEVVWESIVANELDDELEETCD